MQLYLYTTRVGQLSKTFWVDPVCNCICIQQGLDSCPRHFGLILYATVFVFNKGWTVVQDIFGLILYATVFVFNKGWTVVQDMLGWFFMQLYLYSTRVGQLSKTCWVGPVCDYTCIQQGLDSCQRHVGLVLHASVFVYNKGWTLSEARWVGPSSICIQQGLDSCPRHIGLVPLVSVFVFNKGWTVVRGMVGWSL